MCLPIQLIVAKPLGVVLRPIGKVPQHHVVFLVEGSGVGTLRHQRPKTAAPILMAIADAPHRLDEAEKPLRETS